MNLTHSFKNSRTSNNDFKRRAPSPKPKQPIKDYGVKLAKIDLKIRNDRSL